MSKTFAKASSYPLHWPETFPKNTRPSSSRFDTSLFQALENVKTELQLLAKDSGKKLDGITISSNYSLTETKPKDPGVAVWFHWDGEQVCIPVDRYDKVECNLQAIYHCIKADRTKLRHGGYNLVKAAYRGYAALPHTPKDSWQAALGLTKGATLAQAEQAYKRLRKTCHPDHGGNPDEFQRIQDAWMQAQQELQ
jgi:hypothetical protein